MWQRHFYHIVVKCTSMATQVHFHAYSLPHKISYQQMESLKMSDTSGLRILIFSLYLRSKNSPPGATHPSTPQSIPAPALASWSKYIKHPRYNMCLLWFQPACQSQLAYAVYTEVVPTQVHSFKIRRGYYFIYWIETNTEHQTKWGDRGICF